MIPSRWYAVLGPAVLLAVASVAQAQQRGLHIGYVYPAGGQQGATFEAVIGGQFLTGVSSVDVSGGGVQATIVELIQPMSGKELNELRIKIDELLARKAVVRNDFRALEAFRSFKNAKTVKTDAVAEQDKELEELKKKYAGATWTADDEALLTEIRKKIGTAVRRPANPAIGELAVVRITVAPDAEPGQRELRIATPSALSNPLAFYIGQLPEFSAKAAKNITEQKSAIAKTAVAPKDRAAGTGDDRHAAGRRQRPDPARQGGPVPVYGQQGPTPGHRGQRAGVDPLHCRCRARLVPGHAGGLRCPRARNWLTTTTFGSIPIPFCTCRSPPTASTSSRSKTPSTAAGKTSCIASPSANCRL